MQHKRKEITNIVCKSTNRKIKGDQLSTKSLVELKNNSCIIRVSDMDQDRHSIASNVITHICSHRENSSYFFQLVKGRKEGFVTDLNGIWRNWVIGSPSMPIYVLFEVGVQILEDQVQQRLPLLVNVFYTQQTGLQPSRCRLIRIIHIWNFTKLSRIATLGFEGKDFFKVEEKTKNSPSGERPIKACIHRYPFHTSPVWNANVVGGRVCIQNWTGFATKFKKWIEFETTSSKQAIIVARMNNVEWLFVSKDQESSQALTHTYLFKHPCLSERRLTYTSAPGYSPRQHVAISTGFATYFKKMCRLRNHIKQTRPSLWGWLRRLML